MNESPILDNKILDEIANFAQNLGICAFSIADCSIAEKNQTNFLNKIQNIPEDLSYLKRNQELRDNPELLMEGTKSIISCAFSYYIDEKLPPNNVGYISMYARGRDYHKTIKGQLLKLAQKIAQYYPNLKFRALVDSAPFYEQFFASLNQFSFKGKNNLIRIANFGSTIFLGELLLDITLPNITLIPNEKTQNSTNITCPPNCSSCIKHCPTHALTNEKFQVERCISYLTIENKGTIPVEFRPLIGNRIYGCDSCQLSCPFNSPKINLGNNKPYQLTDFSNRYSNDFLELNNLLTLTQEEFKVNFQGSAIYRIGYISFMRNVLVAASNAPKGSINLKLLKNLKGISPILDELITYVENQHFTK